jgi:L-ascorbate metabolism protein UlaG (beta-lactamase superfamily)
MTTFTWLGHASCTLTVGDLNIVIDPFLTGNPTASAKVEDLPADYIIVSHGHGDHTGDVEPLAKRTGATIIANNEIAGYYSKKGFKTHGQQIGGGKQWPFGYLKLTQAFHGSAMADGFAGGLAAGFLLTTPENKKIYIACDTGLFGDMRLIGEEGIDLAILPIGDNYTMGPDDALRAVKMIEPKQVIPYHYSTWDLIQQDADAWAARVNKETKTKAKVIKPGESIEF